MRKKLFVQLISVLWLFNYAVAQNDYPLKPINEYRACNAAYDQWLANTGLAEYLERDTLVIQNGELYLQIKIKGESQADRLNNFKSLQKHYDDTLKIPFNDLMFRNMINIYKVYPTKANVQIVSDNYFYLIYIDKNTRQITVNEENLRVAVAYTEDIHLNSYDSTRLQLDSSDYRNTIAIYRRLLQKFRDYFSTKVSDIDQSFSSEAVLANSPLEFTIDDLRREVITDAGTPIVCAIYNFFADDDDEIDCTPREWLNFKITADFIDTPDGRRALSIKCEVEGRYCAFFADHRPENYNDMETDYSSYLKTKTRQYTNKITKFLTE